MKLGDEFCCRFFNEGRAIFSVGFLATWKRNKKAGGVAQHSCQVGSRRASKFTVLLWFPERENLLWGMNMFKSGFPVTQKVARRLAGLSSSWGSCILCSRLTGVFWWPGYGAGCQVLLASTWVVHQVFFMSWTWFFQFYSAFSLIQFVSCLFWAVVKSLMHQRTAQQVSDYGRS